MRAAIRSALVFLQIGQSNDWKWERKKHDVLYETIHFRIWFTTF